MRKGLIILFTLIAAGAWAQNQKPSTRAYTSVAEAMSVPMGASYKFDVIENGVISHFVTMRRSDAYLKPDSIMVIAMADSVSIAVRQAQDIQPEWFKKTNETDWYNAFRRMARYINLKGGGVGVWMKPGYNYNIDTMKIYQTTVDTIVVYDTIPLNQNDSLGDTGGGQITITSRTILDTVSNTIQNIIFSKAKDIYIHGNGATITIKGNFKRKATSKSGRFYFSNYNSVCPLRFEDCNNITIENLMLNGNADKMTRDAGVVEGDCYGVYFLSCVNVSISNVTAKAFGTDGIYTGASKTLYSGKRRNTSNVKIDNCYFDYNSRQGYTVDNTDNVTCTNTSFSHNGDTTFLASYMNTAPSSGIDLEPIAGLNLVSDYTRNLHFINCTFDNNFGGAIKSALNIVRDIYMDKCYIDNRKYNNQYPVIMGINNFQMTNTTAYLGKGNIYPYWGSGGVGQKSFLGGNTLICGASGILISGNAPTYGCTIDNNLIIGLHDTTFNSYFPYINSAVTFTNNTISYDSGMYRISGPNRGLIQYATLVENNTYVSNIDTSHGKLFTVSSSGSKTVRGETLPINGSVKYYDAPLWPLGTKYTNSKVSAGSVLSFNSAGKEKQITYGNGIPTSGYYEAGSIVIMNNPGALYSYYQCTTAGTAGVDAVFQGYGASTASGRTLTYGGVVGGIVSQANSPDSAIYTTKGANDTGVVIFKIPIPASNGSIETITGSILVRGKGYATYAINLQQSGTFFYQPTLDIWGDSSLQTTKVRLLKDAGNTGYIAFYDTSTVIFDRTVIDIKTVQVTGTGASSLASAAKPWTAIVTRTLAGYTVMNNLVNTSGALWQTMPDKPFTVLANGNVGFGTTTPVDLLEISKNVGGTIGSLRFGGTNGRQIGAYQNGALFNLDFVAASVSMNSTLQMSAQKRLQFYSWDGTSSNFGTIAVSNTGSGTMDFAVNSILAQSITSTGRSLFGAPINPKAYTVSTLPTGNQGDVAVVTDALNPANGATLVGGGAVKVMAFYNGTSWTAVGATTSSTARTLTVSAATTLSLAYSVDYVYTGTVEGTYTLPAINSNTGSAFTIRIFNKSTHNLNINTNAGGSDIYGQGSGATASLVLAPGASANLLPDGTSFDDIK